MIKTECLDANGNVLTHLTQYDLGQKLRVKIEDYTLSSAPEVHFANKSRDYALVVQSTLSGDVVIADIPNEILREPYNIYAYVYVNVENTTGTTIVFVEIPLRKRAKPSSYEYSDNVNIVRLDDLISEVEGLMNVVGQIDIDALSNFSDTINGITTRLTTVENGLSTLDNTTAMKKSVYDPQGYNSDVFAYAKARADEVQDNVDATNRNIQGAYQLTETVSYNNLGDAVRGVYTLAQNYSRALLADYKAFTVTIVNELPLVGESFTFYLVPNSSNTGYDKWWWITDSETEESMWDCFGSATTVVVTTLPQTGSDEVDYILKTANGCVYYKWIDNEWVMVGGSVAEIVNELPVTGSEITDYYLLSNGKYLHYRWINNAFELIGSDAYTKTEVDNIIGNLQNLATTAKTNVVAAVNEIKGNLSTLQTDFNNLANLVKEITISNDKTTLTITYMDDSTSTITLDTGVDIDSTVYNIDDDYTLHFYDSNGNELEDLAVEIRGGGGGGAISGGSVNIGRVTPASVQNIYGDSCTIEYTVTAVDANNDGVGDGTGTIYVNNIAVKSGITVYTSTIGANNSIDVGEYLSVGTNTVKISVSVDTGGETNTVATKTWSVNAINMYLTWNYDDSQINSSAVTDYYTPFGALSKTIYTFIDVDPLSFNPEIVTELPLAAEVDADVNYFLYDDTSDSYTHYVWDESESDYVTGTGRLLNINTTTRSGVQQALTIPMQTHGSHAIVRYMTGDVNGTIIKTSQQVHDMVFNVAGNTTPIIATSFNTSSMIQYNTVQIPIVVYDPSNLTTNVTLAENGNTISTWTNIDRTVHYWNYSPTTYGTKVLTITCGSVVKTITIEVEELDIDEAEVTGYDFRFKASEMATNDAVRNWSNTYTPVGSNVSDTVNMTFSNNFDWINGGLHTEYDDDGHLRQYFVVRAGTTATINYNLFGQNYDPKQYGKAFKFIFKAVNCRTYDANVLTCMDSSNGNNGVGLVMTANEATMTTANNSLKTYYYKDSYMEFEFNIHPTSEYRYLQFWMDGSHDISKLYDTSDSMQQINPVGITIGSNDCDVYIYMVKAYPIYLTNENELSNFIMDAPNAYEMVDRYDRNDILNASSEIDSTKLAAQNPDLHVLLLDLNRMSTGKKDNVVAHTVRHIYNAGGQSECFTVNNACVTIQGTSSVGYLESAGNVDINFKYGRNFTSDNIAYTTGAIAFDDGTNSTQGYAMSDNAIPVDYLNVKLNVASSENANNACIADWYNTYQPWTSPARKKNAKARDTIEFVPGVIFIRDRSGGLFSDTNNYHFYGVCDIGNSKKNTKVFHDTTNPIACCIEVANNTSLPCLMSSKTYTWNSDDEATVMEYDAESGTMKEQKVFEFRYVDDDSASIAESAWDRFVAFMYDHNPNLATNNPLGTSVTFGNYTFKGSGSYDTSDYDSEEYDVVYLYGYGLPTAFNNGIYSAANYQSDTSGTNTCYYYINYSNNYIYSSNGTTWTAVEELTWTADRDNVLAGTSIGTYAGTYTTDSFEYRMAYLLEHCEEYMIMDAVMYHFIFIESYLMTDNVAKNTFWSSDDLVHWELSKDYDNDRVMSL